MIKNPINSTAYPGPLPRGENSPKPNFVLLAPESRKETAFRDLDLALDHDRFPCFSHFAFMGRVLGHEGGVRAGRVCRALVAVEAKGRRPNPTSAKHAKTPEIPEWGLESSAESIDCKWALHSAGIMVYSEHTNQPGNGNPRRRSADA